MKTMRREDFYELADERGLETVEVTTGRNGYPEGLRIALTGFASFDEADDIAREHGLQVVILHRRDGWQLWESEGRASSPIKVTQEMYGDNYELLGRMTSREFYDNVVVPHVEGIDDVHELAEVSKSLEGIWDEIDDLDDGEAVLLHYGEFESTVELETCSWSFDTHNYIIAVM